MSRVGLEFMTLRWWLVAIIIFATLILSISYDAQTTSNLISSNALENPVIIRGSIGLALAILLLSLISARRTTDSESQINQVTNNDWLNDNLPFGAAIWCSNGKLVACNSYYRDRLKLSFEEAKKGTCYIEIMGKIKSENNYKIISDEELVRQIEIINQHGDAIFIDERPIGDDGFITIISDVSEKIKLQKELEENRKNQRKLVKQLHQETIKAEAASRSKTSFLAHLSHDVRTPLNHIIGFADLIAHQTYGPLGDKKYLAYINDIKISGEKLLMSFSEILELAQLEGGELILRNEDIIFADLISNVENKYRSRAKKAGVKLMVSACDETQLYIDRMCCERMIGNIVENAIQFTPKGGKININIWSGDDGVVLEIADTGIGMSPERIADLSQPFVLGDSAFTREGGMGLGIAISRTIAELFGGELAIDSSPAVGTSVAISLPNRVSETQSAQVA